MTKEIYTPEDGECLVVGEEVKSFSIRLGDSIIGGLKLSRVRSSFLSSPLLPFPASLSLLRSKSAESSSRSQH